MDYLKTQFDSQIFFEPHCKIENFEEKLE